MSIIRIDTDPIIMTVSAAGGYTGPLDIVSGAAFAYGQRALSAAKRGTAIYMIQRSSDSATQSFDSDATTGDAPSAAITAFIGGGTGSGTLLTDQSGNGYDLSPPTTPAQPPWAAALANGHPGFQGQTIGLVFGPGAQFVLAGGAFYVEIVINLEFTSAPVFFQLNDFVTSAYLDIGVWDATNKLMYAEISSADGNTIVDWVTTVSTTAGRHVFEFFSDNLGNVSILIDGSDMGAALQSGVPLPLPSLATAQPRLGSIEGTFPDWEEWIYWPLLPSASATLSNRQNTAAYYGITL